MDVAMVQNTKSDPMPIPKKVGGKTYDLFNFLSVYIHLYTLICNEIDINPLDAASVKVPKDYSEANQLRSR